MQRGIAIVFLLLGLATALMYFTVGLPLWALIGGTAIGVAGTTLVPKQKPVDQENT